MDSRKGSVYMKLFFDTEFTGLHKDTTLISIGIVSEDGKKFYAESTDYDAKQCDDWIQDNVLSHTILQGNEEMACELSKDSQTTIVIGRVENIVSELKQWLSQFDDVQFVSDVCHYDFVLLIDLFGTAFDLPKNVSASCHDINQDIASYSGISEKQAFDYNREEFIADNDGTIHDGIKHNSLYDAEVIKKIYDICNIV